MAANLPILDVDAAQAAPATGERPERPVTLRLMPGDFALVESRDLMRMTVFADLCCGNAPLAAGTVRFLGHDWARLPHPRAAALRGRIGHMFAGGGWIHLLTTDENILLAQRHHTDRPDAAMRDEAAGLAVAFGLPGLPMARPRDLLPGDLARAACVRAFLGRPELLLLENPLQSQFVDLVPPLLNALASARDRGAAVMWLTRGDLAWRDRSLPATHRLRLTGSGLAETGGPGQARAT